MPPTQTTAPRICKQSESAFIGYSSLLLLDAGLLDHRAPFGDVVFHTPVHLGGRRALHVHAEVLGALLDRRIGQQIVDAFAHGFDDGLRRAGGPRYSVPAHDLDSLEAALIDGRHVWEIGAALETCGGERHDP